MMRRSIRKAQGSWHSLGEFAVAESDAVAFRAARAADAAAVAAVEKAAATKAAPIDWKKYEDSIAHKDLVTSLKAYHDSQVAVLDSLIGEDHAGKVKGEWPANWDKVYDASVASCEKSVQASEKIVGNGAKALYISANNPSIGEVSTSEWLDTDQYWAAFVEKHHHYHNHLCSIIEDPESKEYDDKIYNDMLANMKLMDDQLQNKLIYQRPSYEYYRIFHGVLVEHMIFYLSKTGGDARFFPELMPHKWFCEIYDIKFKILDELQKDKRAAQEAGMLRAVDHAFTPHDLEHGGGYYARLIQREAAVTEALIGRLMGNYMFLSDAVPVQSEAALSSLASQEGEFFSLGDDVNALFFKPKSGSHVVTSPAEAAQSYIAGLTAAGRTLPKAHEIAVAALGEVLESRKPGLDGNWFEAATMGESLGDAFLRRMKADDPARAVYEEYVAELKARWAEAKPVSAADAKTKIKSVETQAKLEVAESAAIYFDGQENADTKVDLEKLSKAKEAGTLKAMFDNKQLVAFDASGVKVNYDAVAPEIGA